MDSKEDNKTHCPVCNNVIYDTDAEVFNPCEHVMATYSDICGEEFMHIHEAFRSEAEKMEVRANDWYHVDGNVSLDYLMQEFVDSHDGYELVQLTTYGMSCSLSCSTEFHLIKKS